MISGLGDRLRQLLNAYWLRPETALWRACDLRAMAGFELAPPSLDLGCGDGVFSFIRAGGTLAENFDVFQSIGPLDKFFANADVYDSFDQGIAVEVVRRPGYEIDVGLDHKPNLLKKARALGLYAEIKEADANRGLPFADGSFRSVFSNMVYWLEDPLAAMMEIRRVLRPGGQACLLLPNATLRDFSLYWDLHVRTGNPAYRFLAKLDRGRLADNIKQVKSTAEWHGIVRQAGLEVLGHKQYLSGAIARIWDIGLRPLFPVLHKMASKIEAGDRLEIKREWVSTFETFFMPLAEMDPAMDAKTEPAFHCFVLRR